MALLSLARRPIPKWQTSSSDHCRDLLGSTGAARTHLKASAKACWLSCCLSCSVRDLSSCQPGALAARGSPLSCIRNFSQVCSALLKASVSNGLHSISPVMHFRQTAADKEAGGPILCICGSVPILDYAAAAGAHQRHVYIMRQIPNYTS